MAWARATLPAVLLALYAWLLTQGLSRWQHALLEVGEPLASGDVAVVLGHTLDKADMPSEALERRIDAGLQLLRNTSVGAVLFSGGHDGSGLRSWCVIEAIPTSA
jgi:vancomycin permeability regulator SanA